MEPSHLVPSTIKWTLNMSIADGSNTHNLNSWNVVKDSAYRIDHWTNLLSGYLPRKTVGPARTMLIFYLEKDIIMPTWKQVWHRRNFKIKTLNKDMACQIKDHRAFFFIQWIRNELLSGKNQVILTAREYFLKKKVAQKGTKINRGNN